MRRVALNFCLASSLGLTFLGAFCGFARAEFGPIQLVSKSAVEQSEFATEPDLSADGRFVVFVGKLGGTEGVFRKDLQTGAVALVAADAAELSPAPSISGDGRYVSFTTTAQLDPVNDVEPSSKDVYVADMATSPPTYEIASARDGCDPRMSSEPCGLSYAAEGSMTSAAVSLSDSGREVAFVVGGASDLIGDPGEDEAPGGQVVVRDLETDRTYLISARRDPVTGSMTDEPVEGEAIAARGVALSADGTTVAWLGRHLPEQVPMLADEEAQVNAIEASEGPNRPTVYDEPLWRRVPTVAEPLPPTRRVVGGGDPLAPGCPAGGSLAEAACQGPFPELDHEFPAGFNTNQSALAGWWWGPISGPPIPMLSADGNTVALVGNPDGYPDVYVASMAPGPNRAQALHRLTHWGNPTGTPFIETISPRIPYAAQIESLAISPDGGRVAFSTLRTYFPLSPPALLSPPAVNAELPELYQADLATETISRITPGNGQSLSLPSGTSTSFNHSSFPSYSAGGNLLAFSTPAYNLVPGDGNEAEDVFTVEVPPQAPPGATIISPAPAPLPARINWRLTVTAFSRPNGNVRLIAVVPGAGTLRAKAKSQLGVRLKTRRIAKVSKAAAGAGVVQLQLHLRGRLRRLAKRPGGLYSSLEVNFEGAGGAPLRDALQARFRVHHKKQKHRKAKR
jgi:hypothetical protein